MAEDLKCLHCGVRRLIDLSVYDDTGGMNIDVPTIFMCPCCDRFYEVARDSDDKVKLVLKSTTSAIATLRTL